MSIRTTLTLVGALALTGCCGGPQPDVVVQGLQHTVEDMVLLDAELVPQADSDAAQAMWRTRVRAFALRALTLLAWAKDEAIDVSAAHARLFAREGEGDER